MNHDDMLSTAAGGDNQVKAAWSKPCLLHLAISDTRNGNGVQFGGGEIPDLYDPES